MPVIIDLEALIILLRLFCLKLPKSFEILTFFDSIISLNGWPGPIGGNWSASPTKMIFDPLGMDQTMYLPEIEYHPYIVPTEYDSLYRNRLIQAEVHDENTYLMGGISSHAGLFSTSEDLAIYAQMFINGGTWIGRRIFKESLIDEW